MPWSNAIEVKGLRKSYGSLEAVKGIDFTVPAGQVFAFLGPNGAGKTTTVEILEGYRERNDGEIRVLGFDPANDERAMRAKIGIVLQECGFPRYATVEELIKLQSTYYTNSRSVDEVIQITGLNEKRAAVVRSLSGGQKRRLDLALAIVGDPDLIFLDEPTTGFDPSARREAWETIKELRSLGKTIFLTTHYMDEAQYLADYVAVIANGEIVAEGSPETLGGRDTALTRIRFFLTQRVSLPDLDRTEVEINGDLVELRTSEPVSVVNRITSWALERNVELSGFAVAQPTLEDVYLELTKAGESQ